MSNSSAEEKLDSAIAAAYAKGKKQQPEAFEGLKISIAVPAPQQPVCANKNPAVCPDLQDAKKAKRACVTCGKKPPFKI
jgi:hypothetical protein